MKIDRRKFIECFFCVTVVFLTGIKKKVMASIGNMGGYGNNIYGRGIYGGMTINEFSEYWLTDDEICDVNEDGIVNFKDYGIFLGN